MIFGDYEFPAKGEHGKKIKETLEKVIRDYFALYCWANKISKPSDDEEWGGLSESHQEKFKEIIYQIVSEQPLTLSKHEDKWGVAKIRYDHRGNEFVIIKGSVIKQDVASSCPKEIKDERAKMKEDGTLIKVNDGGKKGLKLTKDYPCKKAVSGLASLIEGSNATGTDRIDFGEWRFGNEAKVLKKLEKNEKPDTEHFIGWLLHPDLAKYGIISVEKREED